MKYFVFIYVNIPFVFSTIGPLCHFAYSPCDPNSLSGVCEQAPGEQCYEDIDGFIYCCVPDPSVTTQALTTTAAPAPLTQAPTVQPPFSGPCRDLLTCCTSTYCNVYPTEMRRICPKTCGICTPSLAESTGWCTDMSPECRKKGSLCLNPSYITLMKQQCPFTCGYCANCGDKNTQCNTWAKNGFCTSSHYSDDHKRSYCANSCGYCGRPGVAAQAPPPPPPPSCVDAYSTCATWVRNGFCTNKHYTEAQKKSFCARSCQLC